MKINGFKSKNFEEVHKRNLFKCNSKMASYLKQCQVCGKQCTGSTDTKFR